MVVIAAGLLSRRYPWWQPRVVAAYAGDALWAVMVFWGLALLRPRAQTGTLAGSAFAVALAVEGSQLLSTPWLVAVRDTRLGALALGRGFLWSDIVCYALGIALAALLDAQTRRPAALVSRG